MEHTVQHGGQQPKVPTEDWKSGQSEVCWEKLKDTPYFTQKNVNVSISFVLTAYRKDNILDILV